YATGYHRSAAGDKARKASCPPDKTQPISPSVRGIPRMAMAYHGQPTRHHTKRCHKRRTPACPWVSAVMRKADPVTPNAMPGRMASVGVCERSDVMGICQSSMGSHNPHETA